MDKLGARHSILDVIPPSTGGQAGIYAVVDTFIILVIPACPPVVGGGGNLKDVDHWDWVHSVIVEDLTP